MAVQSTARIAGKPQDKGARNWIAKIALTESQI